SVEIARYGLHLYRTTLSFFVETRNYAMLASAYNETDAFFMFVDADNNRSTGYRISGIGADYMAIFSGWDGSVKSASVYTWSGSRNQTDINGFESRIAGRGAVEGTRFEGQFHLIREVEHPVVVFYAQDNYGNRSRGMAAISTQAGAVIVTQSNPEHGAVNRSLDVELLRININTKAKENRILGLNLTLCGNAIASDFTSIELRKENQVLATANYTDGKFRFNLSLPLEKNTEENVSVFVRISENAEKGKAVGMRIEDAGDVWLENGTSTIYSSFISNTYIEEIPDRIVIDGAFGDWENILLNTDTANDTFPSGRFVWPTVDIDRYGMVDAENVSFYISTHGFVLGGEELPWIIERPAEIPTPPPPEVPVQDGMDAIFVFIDIDGFRMTGFRVYNGEMGAEYMIMITGKNNEINSSMLYRYETYEVEQNWTKWKFVGNVSCAIGSYEMECALPKSILQDIGNRSVIRFATKNWLNAGDWSD
ncbi:MAG: hypothetical protein ACP5LE_08265, partial [Thermoplasmata archaeon]